jgi:DNA-binding SARP family transcriptional activator
MEIVQRGPATNGRCVPADALVAPRTAGLRLTLLNGFRLTQDDTLVALPRGAERLLAYLALTGRRARPHVAGTLWPDVRDEQALACLRSALWRIGRLCQGVVAATPESVDIARDVAVDARRFRDVARTLIEHRLLAGTDRHAFVDLMRMELLPGWYDDWVLVERERLRQLGLHALEAVAAQLLKQGAYAPALEAALAAIAAEPLRESAHRAAVRIHLAEGNVVEARRQYEAYRRITSVELGTSPSREFAELVRRRDVGAQTTAARTGSRGG